MTRRTVLRRERVIVVPDAVPENGPIDMAKLAEALGIKRTEMADRKAGGAGATVAWVVVGEFEGQSDTRAIERHAGKQGTPDAKPGVYKAPPTRSWKGGEVYEKPPEPKVERKRLED